MENTSFDPNKLWAFRSCGPFESADELAESEIFVRQENEAAFAIVDNVTESVVGVIILTNDDPKNLTIQLEPPIIKPSSEESEEQLEACFLLMDRLFAHGYRRIQMSVDAQDFSSKKLAMRLGFTQEGFFPKNMIVKDANRDSWVYGMINTDWNKGARAALFKKLHGAKMQRADAANNVKESELEVQQNFLKEKKEKEAAQHQKKA
jgi:RimJ/RimL family protein N-acetyltransferase